MDQAVTLSTGQRSYTMKFLILLLCCAAPYATPVVAEDDNPHLIRNEMTVPLDHFNLFDNRTLNMRYVYNNEFFEKGNPLFVYIGGESPINTYFLTNGTLYELAKKYKGMLVTQEHRYYGESIPLDRDFEMEGFKYLQIEQALEDLAYFIEHFKAQTPGLEHSKVIVHGCSYPAMLATWIRLRFPHIVDISYASSAPLGVGLDYPEFYEIIHDAYANVSSECIKTIKAGFNQTQELLKTGLGRKTVRDALKEWSCGDVYKMNSVKILKKMQKVLSTMHDQIEDEEMGCLVVSLDDVSAFHKLANFIVVKSLLKKNCADTELNEKNFINALSWKYQTCTEMGTFQTLDRKNPRNPFEMDLSLQESVEGCVKVFGEIATEDVLKNGIDRVTRRYGGKRPAVTKVLTVQGTHDPWKHLAHLEDYNPEAPVMLIRGSHCADITPREDDPEEMFEVRRKIKEVLIKWIDQLA